MSSSKYKEVIAAMERRIDISMSKRPTKTYFQQSALYKPSKSVLQGEDYRTYQIKVALSSWFTPDSIFNWADEETKSVVLKLLDKVCEKRKTDKIEWLMKKSKRTDIINTLYREQSLPSALSLSLPSTDNAGNLMREVLRGKIYDPGELNERQALDLIHALELLSETDVPKQSIDLVREKIQGKFLSEYDVLLQNYVGRGHALSRLHQFIDLPPIPYRPQAIVVTGIGGAGKSTLIAKFLHEVRDKEKASIAILDFDRPGVDADDKNWLMLEMITQLCHQYPRIKPMLASVQDHLRRQINTQERLDIKEKLSSTDLREQASILYNVRDALEKIGAAHRPWLIVFDTFEEVHSKLKAEGLISWVSAISETLGDLPFKIIISGRLFDLEKVVTIYGDPAEVIEVDEFEEDVAQSFLQKLNLSENVIGQVIKDGAIPFRPLELKLLAKLFDDPAFELKQLKSDAANSKFAGKDLFLGIVYRRVLARIKDITARKLAYPGLVLRYLTVPIIQNILIPSIYRLAVIAEKKKRILEEDEQPIGSLTDEQVQLSLNELANRGWLSYKGPKGEIVHQKYLRRSMLKLMISKDPQKAIEIHNAAIGYFKEIGTDDATAEVLYHQLMLLSHDNNAVSFNALDIKSLLPFIKNDIEDLPTNAAVLVKYIETGEVSEIEMELLPGKFFREASLSTIRKYNKRREFLASTKLIKNLVLDHPKSIDTAMEPMFKTIEWSWVRESMRPLTQRENTLFMLDDVFYKSFTEPMEAKHDLLSFFQPILKTFVFNNFKKSIDRYVVSKLAHVSTLYYSDLKKLHADNPIRKILAEFTQRNTKLKADDTSEFRLRGINLLRMLTPEFSTDSTFTPGLIKIDIKWLIGMRKYLDESKLLLGNAHSILVETNNMSVKSILSRLDSLGKNKIKSTFTAPVWTKNSSRVKVMKLLRGPDPEFRDLCRYALLDVHFNWSHVPLGQILKKVLPIKVSDFEPHYEELDVRYPPFAYSMAHNPEKSLEDYIEFADRCWVLGPLLKAVLEECPQATKLRLVYERYQAWDKAVKLAIKNAYDAEREKQRKSNTKKKKATPSKKASKKNQLKKKK